MPPQPTLHIRQSPAKEGGHHIRLTLRLPGQADLEGEATIDFALSEQEQAELRWYMEDYLQRAASVAAETVEQIEAMLRRRGEELYRLVLAANLDTQQIWFAVRQQLADLRVEITTGIAEAAAIPWELMRDPQSDSAIALRVKAFVRVQSNPNLSFVSVPPTSDGRIRLLYVVCRPNGAEDVPLRAVANRLLQDLGGDLERFEITALRPPTFERLQTVLTDAKAAGKPFHIVHFDGHGVYEDLSQTGLADWLKTLGVLTLGGARRGKHGYLLFEHPTQTMRPVPGEELGKLLHDTGVPVLVLNACQSAMHEASERPESLSNLNNAADVHDEVRAIGSLAQSVIDQGIPAVLGMRYSVFVVTAAQYIGQLYANLAKGRSFGEAASEGRKHLARNPERWVGLEPRPLQDWFVPVVYEAMALHLLPVIESNLAAGGGLKLSQRPELDPVQSNPTLRRYVPDTGFIGRDETLLLLDRAFDSQPVVLLHAYAGQGKSSSAVEFARWYSQTGGLGEQPIVLFTSFEQPTTLNDALNQVGQRFAPLLQANDIDWLTLNNPTERRALVVQLLRRVPLLWIWDKVDPVAGFPAGSESQWTNAEQAELADFLKQIKLDRATQVKVLLTSRRDEREWLGAIAQRVAMPRMSRSDAAALAFEIGKSLGMADIDVRSWTPLLDYCAGNPLTLRVIAGQAVRQGLRSHQQIDTFIQRLRDGEEPIADVDASQGRDKSLGASLEYGFRNAFAADELPIIALLHLFQGTVDVDALAWMGKADEHALPELAGKSKEQLTSLLQRAQETGLLTPLSTTHWSIHPALPWYLRQLFARHYDGQAGRSSAEAVLCAWVEAMGGLGEYYLRQFAEGNRAVIDVLALEEANLLYARRTARRHGWWQRVTSPMQGLRVFYVYLGRSVEWARLVAEITPDYCSADDAPITSREEKYSLIMGYRVDLAKNVERDLAKATALQSKVVVWDRQQATEALTLASAALLDSVQHHRIHTLAMSTGTLGQILMGENSHDCVAVYEETIRYCQRIGDRTAEAITHFNLGHAYKDLPAIRNLDTAEAAYQRSLELHDPNDALERAKCIQQIGIVLHERFNEARQRGDATDHSFQHAQAAEQHYQQALTLCPPTAIADLAPMYRQVGNFYSDVGMFDDAQSYYEKDVQIREQTGDRYGAGQTRYNLALMYLNAAEREPARRHDLLRRALAYARASLVDFQHYQGRAAADEAKAQQLIDNIQLQLGG